MTSPYSVHTTPHFDRSLKKLSTRHHLAKYYAEVIDILQTPPLFQGCLLRIRSTPQLLQELPEWKRRHLSDGSWTRLKTHTEVAL